MMRKWMRLPHDVSNDVIHASVSEGGLGIPSTMAMLKTLEESCLLNVEGIGGEEDGEGIVNSYMNSESIGTTKS